MVWDLDTVNVGSPKDLVLAATKASLGSSSTKNIGRLFLFMADLQILSRNECS